MKVLVFDIWGDFAHFKRFYTTSSPLSFSFPPPPTIRGILGAILGYDKNQYLKVFSNDRCSLAIQILKPIKKIRLGLNYINTKGNYWQPVKKKSHEARTQIPCEFIKNPAYRMYVHCSDDNLLDRLTDSIMAHKTFFTVSLGLSELLCDFRYIGVYEFTEEINKLTCISSVIPISSIIGDIVFKKGYKYFKERIPIRMNPDRVVDIYEDVLYEAQGKEIEAHLDRFWRGEDGTSIVFL